MPSSAPVANKPVPTHPLPGHRALQFLPARFFQLRAQLVHVGAYLVGALLSTGKRSCTSAKRASVTRSSAASWLRARNPAIERLARPARDPQADCASRCDGAAHGCLQVRDLPSSEQAAPSGLQPLHPLRRAQLSTLYAPEVHGDQAETGDLQGCARSDQHHTAETHSAPTYDRQRTATGTSA